MTNPFQDAMMRRLNIIGDMGQMPIMPHSQSVTPQQGIGGAAPSGTGESGMKGLLDFGHFLQSKGFRVSEHPAFGGVEPVHVKNSDHYSGHAFDVNYAPGTSAREQAAIDKILKYAQQYGMKYIWRAPGHFNHAHFYF